MTVLAPFKIWHSNPSQQSPKMAHIRTFLDLAGEVFVGSEPVRQNQRSSACKQVYSQPK